MSRGRSRIVVTDLPYQTNKTNLLERIALLVRDGKIEGITDLRDESDRTGMRIAIELTRNVEPQIVLERLLRLTPMQQTFGMSLLALVDGEPRTLTLKRVLILFIEHRRQIIRRRSEFDLAKARARSHIVEGLLKALDILDEVIRTIRRSQRVETARTNLMRDFAFTQPQAQAILDMPLRRLTALERKQLQDEHKELRQRITYLEELLADDNKILGVVRAELLDQRQQHADRRRTEIVERAQGTLTATDLLPDRRVWVALGANGELRRQDFAGITRTVLRQAGQNAAFALFTANTRDHLFIFAADGRCHRLGIHEIPQEGRRHLADLTHFSRRDDIAAMLALPLPAPDGFLFLVTRQGTVKRIALADFKQAVNGAMDVMRVTAKDRLHCAFATPGNCEVLLVTRQGRSIRFPEEMVRAKGHGARGVAGINLKRGDEVIAALPVAPAGDLLTATAAGFVKRTRMSEFGPQGRGGGGIIAHKITARTGDLTGAAMLTPEHAFAIFVTQRRVAKPVALDEISYSGRSTQGSQIVDLAQSDAVASVQAVSPLVSAVDSPPSQPAPQTNGSVDGAPPQKASTRRQASANAGGEATDNGQKSTKAAPNRRKRAAKSTAAAPDNPPAPAQRKSRSLDSETARKRKPDSGKRAAATSKEKPAADNNPSNQRTGPTKTGNSAPDTASSKPSTRSRPTAETAQSDKARADERGKSSPKSADQPVQGRLIEEPPDASQPKGKLDRVSSVTRTQKRPKR